MTVLSLLFSVEVDLKIDSNIFFRVDQIGNSFLDLMNGVWETLPLPSTPFGS